VTVTPAPVSTVTVSPPTPTVVIGTTTTLAATTKDALGAVLTGRSVTWSSANNAIATVNSNGVVTGVALGTVTITATSEGKTGTALLTVIPVPVASVTVTPLSANIFVGAQQTFAAITRDASGQVLTGRAVSWSSSANSVATVSANGVATGAGAGNAVITATSEGKSGTAAIAVAQVPVGTVTVLPSPATVVATQTTQLTATVKDQNGTVVTDRTVTWATNNPTIATVSTSGLVLGVTPGSATITATSGGKSGSTTVTVTPVPVAMVTVTPSPATVRKGSNVTLTAILQDASGNTLGLTGRVVTWSSSDTSKATVSSTGVVHGVAEGTAVITATSEGKSGTSTVTVTK
jgi:uncharacterized protein YjdB